MMTRFTATTIAALLLTAPLSAQESGQSPSGETVPQVVTVVTVPTPAGLPVERIAAGMEASLPQYQAIPGLERMYFTIGEGVFGGVYVWTNRQAAEAWFSAAWHERVRKTYGADGTVTHFSVPVTMVAEAK